MSVGWNNFMLLPL